MYIRPTAPRSIGGVLDDGFRLWRAAFSKTWPVALMAQLLALIPVLILVSQGTPIKAGAQLITLLAQSAGLSIAYLVVSIATIGFHNAVIVQTGAAVVDRVLSMGQGLAEGFRLLGRTFLLGVLIVIGVLLPIGALYFALLGVSTLARIVFAVIAFLALCYVLGKVILASIILIVEDKTATASLRRSWMLTSGYWWRVGTILTVLLIVIIVAVFLVGVIAALLAGIFGASSGAGVMMVQLVSVIGNTLITPLYAAVAVAIYYDLILRKEGGDLANRVSALAPQ